MRLPPIKRIAHLPTPIYELDKISKDFQDVQLYIKRDDFTGIEYSGNKVRKLECIIPDVLELECDVLITCGGIQSNHCRATASVAAKLGLKSHLVLKGNSETLSGNFFLDKMFDANKQITIFIPFKGSLSITRIQTQKNFKEII